MLIFVLRMCTYSRPLPGLVRPMERWASHSAVWLYGRAPGSLEREGGHPPTLLQHFPQTASPEIGHKTADKVLFSGPWLDAMAWRHLALLLPLKGRLQKLQCFPLPNEEPIAGPVIHCFRGHEVHQGELGSRGLPVCVQSQPKFIISYLLYLDIHRYVPWHTSFV